MSFFLVSVLSQAVWGISYLLYFIYFDKKYILKSFVKGENGTVDLFTKLFAVWLCFAEVVL